ncbi:STN domain-containing protein, partial [Lysobacter sp. 2RAB21]
MLLLSLACSAALSAQAQGAAVNIPAGDLVTALDALARQSGVQFVYSADQLKGLRTQGVHGSMAPADALDRLLRGSGYAARRDASGAMVIVKSAAPAAPPSRPRNTPRTPDGAAADMPVMTELESIQ